MSTGLAARARIDFDDLHSERRYRMTAAYGQSKRAGLPRGPDRRGQDGVVGQVASAMRAERAERRDSGARLLSSP